MLFFNNINIPLAIFTVVLRRFIDKFRAAKVDVSVACSVVGWVLRNPLTKPIICGYMFVAAVRYALKHFRKGNMVTLTRKNLRSHNTLRDRRRILERKKSWVLRNLARNRNSQEKVLSYISSLTPDGDTQEELSPSDPSYNRYESNVDLNSLASNPYYKPRSSLRDDDGDASSNCSVVSVKSTKPQVSRKQTSKLTCPTEYDTPAKPSDSMETFYSRVYGSTCRSELSGMPESLNRFEEEPKKERKIRRLKERGLQLRRRNVLREERQGCKDKMYRKTRSGRIYGQSTATKLSSR